MDGMVAEDDVSGMERSLSEKYLERWSSPAFIPGVDPAQVQLNWALDWMNEWVSARMVHAVLPQRGSSMIRFQRVGGSVMPEPLSFKLEYNA
jgi:hypothetical protein